MNNLPVGLIGAEEFCMRCFPTALKPRGWSSPIIDQLQQRSLGVARLAYHCLWLLLLIDVTTFQKAHAQEPGGPRVPPASFQTTVVQGVVAQYLMNPDGFVDGLLLSNNIIVRFPPHLGQVLTQNVSPQDRSARTARFEFSLKENRARSMAWCSWMGQSYALPQPLGCDMPPSCAKETSLRRPATERAMSMDVVLKRRRLALRSIN